MVFYGFFLILHCASIFWTYTDAEENFSAGIFWAAIVLIFPPLGFIVYMIYRSIANRPPHAREDLSTTNPEFSNYTVRGLILDNLLINLDGASEIPLAPFFQQALLEQPAARLGEEGHDEGRQDDNAHHL